MWSTQLWFYLLPLGGYRLLDTVGFWLGAVYVTFPLGLLLYGWNDWADYETDQRNPRKGNLLFGAKLGRQQLAQLPKWIVLVQLPFFAALLMLVGVKFLAWIAAAVAVNACYNLPQLNFKGRPVLDVACQAGYLLVFVLASWVNDVPQLPWPVFVFGALFAMHSHLLAEITDIEPDRAAGRWTTAVVLGAANTKLVVAGLLLVESMLAAGFIGRQFSTGLAIYGKWLVVVFLAAAAGGFLADYFSRGAKTVSEQSLAWVLIAWNLIAVASMYFVWRAGLFVG